MEVGILGIVRGRGGSKPTVGRFGMEGNGNGNGGKGIFGNCCR